MAKKIYLVRHGETHSNVASLIQDGLDELTERGQKQAEILADRLVGLNFQNLLASDYIRTRQTLVPLLAKTPIEPVYTPLLRELRRPTQFFGVPRHSDEFLAFEELVSQHVTDPEWHFADEENFHDVLSRVQKFFEFVDTLEGDTVAVTHGRFVIFAIMYVLTRGKLSPDFWPADFSTFTTTNTGITVLTYKENKNIWALTTYNDHAHFAEVTMYHMKTIYFVRHGQAEGNESAVFKKPEAPLTERGIKESHNIADILKDSSLELIVTGLLVRTQDTANIIGSVCNIPVYVNDCFSGIKHASSMAGKSKEGPEAEKYLMTIKSMYNEDPDSRFEDAENYTDLHKRLCLALDFLENRPEKRIVVVTHESILKSLLILILHNRLYSPTFNIDMKKHLGQTTNTGISEFCFNGTWKMVRWNDN